MTIISTIKSAGYTPSPWLYQCQAATTTAMIMVIWLVFKLFTIEAAKYNVFIGLADLGSAI